MPLVDVHPIRPITPIPPFPPCLGDSLSAQEAEQTVRVGPLPLNVYSGRKYAPSLDVEMSRERRMMIAKIRASVYPSSSSVFAFLRV